MQKHLAFLMAFLVAVFLAEGTAFLFSSFRAYSDGFRGSAVFSLFIAFIHFFIVFGLIKRKKWTPHIGIFFQVYLVTNFAISNSESLFSPVLFPSVVTVLSVSVLLAGGLFILRNQFTE